MITCFTSVGCYINRFGFSPPNVREELTINYNVRKDNIFYCAFVTVLNTNAAVTVSDNTVDYNNKLLTN
jgi:hypothetical protein